MLILWDKQKYFEFAIFCKKIDFSDDLSLKKKETKFIKKKKLKKNEIKKNETKNLKNEGFRFFFLTIG